MFLIRQLALFAQVRADDADLLGFATSKAVARARIPVAINVKLQASPGGDDQLGAGRTARIFITDTP